MAFIYSLHILHLLNRVSFHLLSPLIRVLDCERARASMVVHGRAFLLVSISSPTRRWSFTKKVGETGIRTADLRVNRRVLTPKTIVSWPTHLLYLRNYYSYLGQGDKCSNPSRSCSFSPTVSPKICPLV